MEREIKFRLWNPERKVLTGGNGLMTLLMTTDKEFCEDFVNKGMVWMQFTGLKDKNGKEIYEGDIIQYKLLKTDNTKVVITCEVAQSKYGWYPFTDELYCMDKAEEIEIIGTIYSTPELIKDK